MAIYNTSLKLQCWYYNLWERCSTTGITPQHEHSVRYTSTNTLISQCTKKKSNGTCGKNIAVSLQDKTIEAMQCCRFHGNSSNTGLSGRAIMAAEALVVDPTTRGDSLTTTCRCSVCCTPYCCANVLRAQPIGCAGFLPDAKKLAPKHTGIAPNGERRRTICNDLKLGRIQPQGVRHPRCNRPRCPNPCTVFGEAHVRNKHETP